MIELRHSKSDYVLGWSELPNAYDPDVPCSPPRCCFDVLACEELRLVWIYKLDKLCVLLSFPWFCWCCAACDGSAWNAFENLLHMGW